MIAHLSQAILDQKITELPLSQFSYFQKALSQQALVEEVVQKEKNFQKCIRDFACQNDRFSGVR
jgi:hypothetical protein